ncbi:MAG: YaeQ family protein [Nitrospirae bacterium]|nr:YaeQ family protein [Nitrospirota bacterium]
MVGKKSGHTCAVDESDLDGSRALAQLAMPSMQLQCTIQEGQIWMANGEHTVQLELTLLKQPATPSGR